MLRRIGLLIGLYMLLRLVFYIFNYSTFAEAEFSQTILAFAHGLRFDLAALTIINIPFILLSLFPHQTPRSTTFQRILLWLFILSNVPFIALGLVDVEFFKFIGQRSSNEVLTITGDIADQLGQLARYYWYLGFGFILLVIGLVKVYPRTKQEPAKELSYILRYLRLLLVAALAILTIRGGIQLKPLRTSHAFILQPAALGHLTLNSPFTFFKSIGQQKLEEKNYFPDEQALQQALHFNPDKYKNQPTPPFNENVVIIILESFAGEYIGALNSGKGYTPYFDSLATQGVLFKNNFANGRKSIEALPSVLAGLPSFMQSPYITSAYQTNTLYGLGTVLKEAGYKTAFFHGAANGTMGFNNFSKQAGIGSYYGLDEYPAELKDKNYDGQWGIFDEPYLQYVAKELTNLKQPFGATVFTLSSHQPYTVPAKYKGKFPKGDLEIHESIGYADYALHQFFKAASQQPWYNNTLFILTADHTQMSSNVAYQNELGNYRIPLLLFHPRKQFKSINPERVTQQADIFPTIVDYLNLSTDKALPFGESVLDSTAAGRALFYNGNSYFMVQQDGVTELLPDDKAKFYTFPDLTPATENPAQEQQLKAYVQYFRNGLVSNNLYFWRKEK
ncbi:LTA synthase family protein [Pontibacter vulgaris]|uniref:LTA synthase family protein n=1 Tax=Pontibacter vulgaris TaxID=2905679 RepID=UPI001FA6E4E9|nr:LTA synthase family protein [Pontibacter vulgaris]